MAAAGHKSKDGNATRNYTPPHLPTIVSGHMHSLDSRLLSVPE